MQKPPRPAGTSSRLRVGRVSEAFGVYSVTKIIARREPILLEGSAADLVVDSLSHLRSADRLKLFAFCVMPNHVHVAFCLMPCEELSDVIGSFTKFTSRRINQRLKRTGPVWQEGFHDRRCRDRDELATLCEYIEHNPVRAGLTATDADWRYSSASPALLGLVDREWWP